MSKRNEKRGIKMHYVIGDIHNELTKLKSILNQIKLTKEDELIVLGDVFDRGEPNADPVGVYFELLKIQAKCTWIRGNHDQWLADYICEYYSKTEKQQKKMYPFMYNSFELMNARLTEMDMLYLANRIYTFPLQKELELDEKKYLFAHAMTSLPEVSQNRDYYLMGTYDFDVFLGDGMEGFISICGHTVTESVLEHQKGMYLDEYKTSIWRNEKGNVYLLDCGCGFTGGRLACMCLETGERFYSD